MGYADGYYYGQGRIICDTSTFSVGDTIRVRSMTDSSKVWNQQVATVGTALVFTVPCYDYYKICTVQTINDTPTEIGGVYKTVDYGQTYFIDNMFDLHTLRGIQGVLDNHNEAVLNIGDEVTIGVAGVDTVFQIGGINLYDTHEVIFVAKYVILCDHVADYWNRYSTNSGRTDMGNYYNSIDVRDKVYIKEKTVSADFYAIGGLDESLNFVWLPTEYEIMASSRGGYEQATNVQFPIFTTQSNRAKKDSSNTLRSWLTASHGVANPGNRVVAIATDGNYNNNLPSDGLGMYYLPCFHLTADS